MFKTLVNEKEITFEKSLVSRKISLATREVVDALNEDWKIGFIRDEDGEDRRLNFIFKNSGNSNCILIFKTKLHLFEYSDKSFIYSSLPPYYIQCENSIDVDFLVIDGKIDLGSLEITKLNNSFINNDFYKVPGIVNLINIVFHRN